jgi:tetratricopeptide (TPR) repeat protein
VRLARAAGYRLLEGNASTALAEIELILGQRDHAAERAGQALAIHRETGLGEARTLRLLGEALLPAEDADAALPHWRAALAIFDDAGASPEAGALRDLLARRQRRAVARGDATRP